MFDCDNMYLQCITLQGDNMQRVIQKWGNSNAVRLPKPLLKSVGLRENDPVDLIQEGEGIVIRKAASKPRHKTLKERLAEAGVAPDYTIVSSECDASSVGDEVFW
ncbi:MAG TPA: AbrB/MazE/SpoVT family DNA-binding domain-containing protein [Coriobacteriia bacterium]|nr:AbrB/MazE/SpoVT family DNA-binding domain-containing protein [Coriobacteriia bacterium]